MPEKHMLAMLELAESWAARAGTSLTWREQWTPATFVAGRRPSELALLSAAAELHDAVVAMPGGQDLVARLNAEAVVRARGVAQ
jgi:hypothetical protein